MKRILELPDIKQQSKKYCGPAILSMFLGFLGHEISQEEAAELMGNPWEIKREGVSDDQLRSAVKELGFITRFRHNLNLNDIVKLIDKNLPIIAPCKSERGWVHYYAIRGYQTKPNIVFVNDPGDLRRKRFTYREFIQMWREPRNGFRNYGITVRRVK